MWCSSGGMRSGSLIRSRRTRWSGWSGCRWPRCLPWSRLGDLELRDPRGPAPAAGEGVRGGLADAPGEVCDASALAGGAGELSEFAGTGEMGPCFFGFTGDMESGSQITAQACLSAGEAAVHACERGSEFGGGSGVAKVDEAVPAPAGQVSGVEGEVGQVLTAWPVADLRGGEVEGVAAGALLPGGGGHLGLGGAEPRADLVRDGGVSLVVGGPDHVEGLGGVTEVEQDIRLLPRCER